MEKNNIEQRLTRRATGYAAIGLACGINLALVLGIINLNNQTCQAQNRIDNKPSGKEIIKREFAWRLISELKQRVYGEDIQKDYTFGDIDMQKRFMEIYSQRLLERRALN